MKAFGYTLLLLFGAYAALKYYTLQVTVQKRATGQVIAPPGINYYCDIPAPANNLGHVNAALTICSGNCDASVGPGFTAAFGPQENQPCNIAKLEI